MLEFYEKQNKYQNALNIYAKIMKAIEMIDKSYNLD